LLLEVMDMDTNVLKGKIIAKFGSLGAFSSVLGWKPNRLSRILSGRQQLTHDDMCDIIRALGLSSGDEIVEVFSLA